MFDLVDVIADGPSVQTRGNYLVMRYGARPGWPHARYTSIAGRAWTLEAALDVARRLRRTGEAVWIAAPGAAASTRR